MNRFLHRIEKSRFEAPAPAPVVVMPSPLAQTIRESPAGALPVPDLLETSLIFASMMEDVPMWLQFIVKMQQAIPYVVAGIQHIHGDAMAGADKKTLAMDALGLSYGLAKNVAPEHLDSINAATVLAATTIDNVVSFMKTVGESPKGLPAPTK